MHPEATLSSAPHTDSCAKSFELGNTHRGHRANQCAKDVIGRVCERGADSGPKNCYKDPQEKVHEYSIYRSMILR
jgi:hypothetical protein